MHEFDTYFQTITDVTKRNQFQTVVQWIEDHYPTLTRMIKWNQPMFIDNGTFIISLTASKHHFSVSPEFAGITHFSARIKASGYTHLSMQFQIPWDAPVDYQLLHDIIDWNREQKKGLKTFWRAS